MEKRFYICEVCGNLVEIIENNGPKLFCCGKPMNEIVANTQEAATEKHIPVVNIEGDVVNVEVGSVIHPMSEQHYIGFVYIVTSNGVRRKDFKKDESPIVRFKLDEKESLIETYAYCNLHGLWKSE